MRKVKTSVMLDSTTREIVDLIGASYQRIFERGLVAYSLDGKIKDPKILATIKRRHEQILEELRLEEMVHEQLVKFLSNNGSSDEEEEKEPDEKPLEPWEEKTIMRL